MAPSETTTLRVPVELRDEIARLAQRRGTTMLDVVADAVARLRRDEWWDTVHAALDRLPDEDIETYRAEADRLDAGAASDLERH